MFQKCTETFDIDRNCFIPPSPVDFMISEPSLHVAPLLNPFGTFPVNEDMSDSENLKLLWYTCKRPRLKMSATYYLEFVRGGLSKRGWREFLIYPYSSSHLHLGIR